MAGELEEFSFPPWMVEKVMEKLTRLRETWDTVSRHNLAAVHECMERSGLVAAEYEFDGQHDDGAIRLAALQPPDADLSAVAEGMLAYREINEEIEILDLGAVPLGEALGHVAWGVMQAHYGGWETNEGALGTLTVSRDAATVKIRPGRVGRPEVLTVEGRRLDLRPAPGDGSPGP